MRTVRAECLDWTVVWNRQHLQRLLTRYVEHYNTGHLHRGLDLDVPMPVPTVRRDNAAGGRARRTCRRPRRSNSPVLSCGLTSSTEPGAASPDGVTPVVGEPRSGAATGPFLRRSSAVSRSAGVAAATPTLACTLTIRDPIGTGCSWRPARARRPQKGRRGSPTSTTNSSPPRRTTVAAGSTQPRSRSATARSSRHRLVAVTLRSAGDRQVRRGGSVAEVWPSGAVLAMKEQGRWHGPTRRCAPAASRGTRGRVALVRGCGEDFDRSR